MSGSMEVHKGGYEMDIFVVKPREEFGCALCSKILKDPHQCTNGHCFCHDCISSSLSRIPECPTCNIITSDANLSKNLMLQRIVEQEITFCPSIAASCCDGDKCHWTGPLHSRSSHYESICEFYPMKCSNGGCTETIQRRKMVEHLEYCSFRRVCCPYCPVSNTTTFNSNQLSKHQHDCIYRPVLCKCSESIPFHLFESHELNSCSRTNVPCPRAGLVNFICPNCPGSAERGVILDHIIGESSKNSNSNSNNSYISGENGNIVGNIGVYQAIQKIAKEFDGILNQKSLFFTQEKADLVTENARLRAELEEYKNKSVTSFVDTNNTGTTAIAESTNTDKNTDNNSNTNSNINITPPAVETTSAVPLSTEPIKRSSIHHLINKLETSGTSVPVPPQSNIKNSVKIGTSMVLNKKEQREHQKLEQKLKQNDQNLVQNLATIPATEEPTKAPVASVVPDLSVDTPADTPATEMTATDNTASATLPVETAASTSVTTTTGAQVEIAPPTTTDAATDAFTTAAAVETTVNNTENNNNAGDTTAAAATATTATPTGSAEIEETEINDNDDDQQESATDGTDNSFSPALSPASRQARRTSKFISDNDMKSLRKQIDNRSEEEKRESQKHEGNKRDHYAKLGSTFVSEKVLSTAPGSGPGGAGRGRGTGRGGGIR